MAEAAALPSRRPILLLFTLSGASALIYQVIWARQFGFVFGNTTTSVSIVLGAFMAGLALGAAIAGRRLVQRRNPMLQYAVLEASIGIYAVLLPAGLRGLEALYPTVFSDETPLSLLTLARASVAFALLVVPTTMMGATLPLTTEYVHRLQCRRRDWNAGRLYGANTFGAALGSFASGFLLIELVGIRMTTIIAALLNLAVGAMGLWLSRGMPERTIAARAAAPPIPRHARRWLILFAMTGGLALAGEVVWTRALTLLLGSSTYAFSAMLIVYLVGIAFGSWMLSGFVRRIKDPEHMVPVAVILAGGWHVLAVQTVPAVYRLHDRLLGDSGVIATPELMLKAGLYLAAVSALMLPPAILSGALFPAITRLVGGEEGDQGGPVSTAYTWNTVGAIGGSLLGGFVLAPFFFHFHAIHALAILFAAVAVGGGFAIPRSRRRGLAAATTLGSLCLAAWAARGLSEPDLFVSMLPERRPGYEVLYHESGLQGITSVIANPRTPNRSALLLVNGAGMTVKVFATKAMAHLPILASEEAADTLVICFGMGTTFRAARAHGGRVDVVELVSGVTDAFELFYDDAEQLRADPSSRILVNDGRNFLLLTRKKYDVITVDPPPPIDSAGVNNLYSREFLELIRDHLKEGGIAAHWIPSVSPSNGVHDFETMGMLVATFEDVFPFTRAVRGQRGFGLHLLGSSKPFTLSAERFHEARKNPAVARDLAEFPWDPVNPATLLQETLPGSGAWTDLPLITDDRPRIEFHLLRSVARGKAHHLLRTAP